MNALKLKAHQLFTRFLCRDEGITAIEYALIAALVALVIIVGVTALGSSLNSKFVSIATSV
ncbi:Flp family type IVb pilin [Polynucleobacter sp. MWH-Mekk-B1]|uniref:Flp family type IVb pilin n=1 Tax=Polynucleobacter finlandensis TaxID=1855894 RepID=UPI001C0AC694|nr:Flp family type IVb pilin [Polynucleobacter finlandensis]MBU3545432.1 Flp family type IVb pilin [Polynucleobacter finlandensis]